MDASPVAIIGVSVVAVLWLVIRTWELRRRR
jgi:hypothetical protein